MKKRIIAIGAVVLVIALVFAFVDIKTPEQYYLEHIDDISSDSKTVFLSIRCQSILDNYSDLDKKLQSEKYVPTNGMVLAKTEYVLRNNDTVYDILARACKANKIQLEHSGGYVQGINYLYEFSCGPLSGWMYTLNNDFPKGSANECKLKDGDEIDWIYTCDLGRDIGNEYGGNNRG